jgi:two-component system chemotaxis response regulator CheY
VTNLRNLRVLLVDDEPFMRRTIKAMLRVIDKFVITEADDGESALRLIATKRPDVVFCDISMKPLDGLGLVERLRNHPDPALRDVAVVMLTVDAGEITVRNVSHLNIQGYLVKPVSPKQIGDRLHTIFHDRQPVPGEDVDD